MDTENRGSKQNVGYFNLGSVLVGLVIPFVAVVGGVAFLGRSELLVAGIPSLTIGGVLSRNITPNLTDTSQRRLTQVVVTVYLITTAALTILAPTLMLNLISIAYFFVTQLLPALFGLLFLRQFSTVGLTAGLIAGNAAVLVLHFSQANVAGINIGLIALLLNLAVTFAVSAVAKNDSSPAPLAASHRMEERRAKEMTV